MSDIDHMQKLLEEMPSSPYPEADAFMICAGVPELIADIRNLRDALRAIVEFEPADDARKITHDSDSCEDCQMWRRRKHPIQHSCEVWYREYYQRESDIKHNESTQHYHMRDIARRALDARRGDA